MLNMKPYIPSTRIAVRESIDEDLSDEIEDDVFIRDRKSIKAREEKGLKRPLMAPRRRSSGKSSLNTSKAHKTVSAILRKKGRCWKFCEPFCYAFAAIIVLILVILIIIFLMALFPVSLQKIKAMFYDNHLLDHTYNAENIDLTPSDMFLGEQTPCTQMLVKKQWSKAFSLLSTESPVRKFDINGDGVIDILFGYSADNSIQYPLEHHTGIPKCEIENNGYREMVYCQGGILALDGLSGNTIWQRWTPQIIFSLFCSSDLNKDGQIDCIISGRGGFVLAVNGRNGNTLWHLKSNVFVEKPQVITAPSAIDLYTVNEIRDLDGDMVVDILAARVEEHQSIEQNPAAGYIVIISGQSGEIIRTISTPNQEEIYVPLQLYTQIDGTEMILVLTGGQSTAGGVYLISLNTIMDSSKENNFITVFRNENSGFMVPAIISDLNEDGVDDIVVSAFNSTVFAFNGQTFEVLWNFFFADSESISSIVPGHYNNDNITDFLVKYNCGGFPVYYYSQTQIINGKNGSALLDQMINDSGGANSLLGGISISQIFGGDLFLHWQTHCRGKYDVKEPYQFFPDSDIFLQTRADTCMLRYNASTVLNLYAINRHIKPPGAKLFSTDDLLLQLNQTELKQLEKQIAVSPLKHPKLLKNLLKHSETNSTVKPTNITVTKSNNNSNNDENRRLFPNQENLEKKQSDSRDFKQQKLLLDKLQKSNVLGQNNFEKPEFNEQTNEMDIQLPSANENLEAKMNLNQRQNQIKNYILRNRNRAESERNQYDGGYMQEAIEEQQQAPGAEDYQSYYDENLAERKLGYALNNRDVRSDRNVPDEASYNDSFSSLVHSGDLIDATESLSKTKKKDKAETLWDLELEKETEEQENHNNEMSSSNDEEIRKRRDLSEFAISTNQNLLTQISSTGVLLKSVEKTDSTLDIVFLLNVRESELYPPLFLAEDIKCLEGKLNAYQNEFSSEYSKNNIESIEKHFLKQCLEQRLPNLTPHTTRFESQIVATRISITCSCGDLKAGEKCSTFNTIENQKWTEFMGNTNNGVY